MTISVVIPAYNEEKYLSKTLISIAQLDRKPDEIIVIDGGSTDKTASIAKQYGARPVTIEHRGIGYARQKGLMAATCDAVAFTDADTIVPHDWLSKIEESLNNPNVVGVYSGYKIDEGWLIYRFFINSVHPIIWKLSHALHMEVPGGQNIAFLRMKGIEVGGFPIDFKSVEDYEMIRRLKQVGVVVYRHDNYVVSSGRRGKEGFSMIFRVTIGMIKYFITRKADTFDFPDIR